MTGPETSALRRGIMAGGTFAALVIAVFASAAARVAETPGAGASGRGNGPGPAALGVLRYELARQGTDRPGLEVATANRALAVFPLASDPFTALAVLGLDGKTKAEPARNTALLQEALRRDPRSRTARIFYLRQLAMNGDLKGAFNQLAVLWRLNPALVEQVMVSLSGQINSPRRVDQALDALKGHDALYLPFVTRMAGKNKPRDVVERLADGLPASALANPDLRRALVGQLVAAGSYARARQIWAGGLKQRQAGLVHAPDFADLAAPPPFNWKLEVNATGAAERSKGGGLTVAYYDRAPGPLAAQILVLAPGNYRAVIDYASISGSARTVKLQVSCMGANTVLGETWLGPRRAAQGGLAVPFTVPAAGCDGQLLAIVGVANEERGEMQLAVRRIDVLAGGSP